MASSEVFVFRINRLWGEALIHSIVGMDHFIYERGVEQFCLGKSFFGLWAVQEFFLQFKVVKEFFFSVGFQSLHLSPKIGILCGMPLQVHCGTENDTCTSSTDFSPGWYKLHFIRLFSVTCWGYKSKWEILFSWISNLLKVNFIQCQEIGIQALTSTNKMFFFFNLFYQCHIMLSMYKANKGKGEIELKVAELPSCCCCCCFFFMAKSEIFDSKEIVCDACGVTLLGGSGSRLPQKILKNSNS